MGKKGIKQSTLNFILGGSAIFLSVILVILSIQVMGSFLRMKAAEEKKAEFRQLGIDLADASDYLTNEARAYVQFGDKVHYDNYWREVNETKTRDKVVERLKELGAPQNELDLLAEAKKYSDTLVTTEDQAMKAVEKGNFEEARRLMFDAKYDSDKSVIMAPIDKFQETMNARAAGELDQAVHQTQTYIIIMILLMVFTAVFNGISLLLSHTKIIRPIIKIKDYMMTAADGNLSQSMDLAVDDTEIGQLAMASGTAIQTVRDTIQAISYILTEMSNGNLMVEIKSDYKGDYEAIKTSLNRIIQSFNQVLGEVKEAAGQVALGAGQVSGSSIALSQGATEQAASVEELSASITIIADQAEENSSHVKIAAQYVEEARIGVNTGNDHMKQLTKAMENIDSSSTQIENITKVIEDIAFQTNILALNAAVEAARAGDAGKGFAVVADEVRNLAAKSAEAARQTADLIHHSAVTVAEGSQITARTAKILQDVKDKAEKANESIVKIERASSEQAVSIEQVRLGLVQVSAVVQTNAATAEENSATSEEMSAQASALRDEVERFKLNSKYEKEPLSSRLSPRERSYGHVPEPEVFSASGKY